ncbi:MAC Perforin domain containing protein, putative [Babesia ovata]|uniref:MAC Perforin domain containing protein, putative n=1 Tax=Babesia ovata TaxID=189622 RepID=A0A2H6KIC0_9APIC|nr:MAC Perforin domain containing protein, putative [Babesia ovata]GBE62742.1 MAC Perforin domain containing protein, putative [Babesia ovata]
MKLHTAVTPIVIIFVTHVVICVRNKQIPSSPAQLKQAEQSPALPSLNNSQSNNRKSEYVEHATDQKDHVAGGEFGEATLSGKEDKHLSQGKPGTDVNPDEINTSVSLLKDVKGEYLGCGYDVTKSRPFGDDESFVDTGYTQPVIQFQWNCADGGKPPTTPIGVWVRKEASCHKGHTTREIKTEETLGAIFSEDVVSSVGAGVVSATSKTEKKDVKKLKNFVKKHGYALKSKCAVFSTGIFLSEEWNVTRGFRNAIRVLVDYEGKEKCSKTDDYRRDGSCADYYDLWKAFFNSYGTHVIFRLTMGGKLLRIVENLEKNETNAKSKERQAKVDIQLSIINANASMNSNKEDDVRKALTEQNSKCFVMGGDNLASCDSSDSFDQWMESVQRNAMPINIQLTPVSQFIPKEIRGHCWRAFKVYNDVHT